MNKRILPVSVIIPTLNRPNALARTIDTLLSMQAIPAQIIVVDQSNAVQERKRTRDYLAQLYEITTVYCYLETPSITAARNVGVDAATYDILLFMDDDVDVNPDTLENVYRYMCDETVVMLGVVDETLPAGSGKLGYLFGMKSWKHRKIGHVTLSMLGRYPDRIKGVVPTMWAMGFCFSLKKDKLEEWGFRFDENLTGYAYAEDLDLTYMYYKQAKAEGLQCLLAEDLRVKHLESKEYRIPSSINTFKFVINREYLSYKHKMGTLSRLCSRWTNFAHYLLRLCQGQGAGDVLRAQLHCDRIRSQLRRGVISEASYHDD